MQKVEYETNTALQDSNANELRFQPGLHNQPSIRKFVRKIKSNAKFPT